jgi:hypothetical protein
MRGNKRDDIRDKSVDQCFNADQHPAFYLNADPVQCNGETVSKKN